MITLEQIEKLREKASVSYEEAKNALERSNGNLLDALILLEREGKTAAPQGGSYSTGYANPILTGTVQQGNNKQYREGWENFKEVCQKIGRFIVKLIRISCENYLDVTKNGNNQFSLPLIALVLLLVLAFWVVLPLIFISLFFGFKYRFRGNVLGKDAINNTMERIADAFEKVVKS